MARHSGASCKTTGAFEDHYASKWATRRRRAEKASAEPLTHVPLARTIARLMTIARDTLTKVESIFLAAVENSVPAVVEAREIIADFNTMVCKMDVSDLTLWITRAIKSLVSSFGGVVVKDEAAVRGAGAATPACAPPAGVLRANLQRGSTTQNQAS